MTNLQLYLAIGIPMLAIIASLIISLVQISGIREDMRETMRELRTDFREIRDDIKIITGKLAEMDTRISLIEERLKS